MVVHERSRDGVTLGLPTLTGPVTPSGTPEVNQDIPRAVTAHFEAEELDIQVEVRYNMVLTWQAPIMLMSYSVVFFLLGLSIYVLTPLYDGRDFDGDARVSAVIYIDFCVKLSKNDANVTL